MPSVGTYANQAIKALFRLWGARGIGHTYVAIKGLESTDSEHRKSVYIVMGRDEKAYVEKMFPGVRVETLEWLATKSIGLTGIVPILDHQVIKFLINKC